MFRMNGQVFAPAKPAFPPSMAVTGFCSCKTGISTLHGGHMSRGQEAQERRYLA